MVKQIFTHKIVLLLLLSLLLMIPVHSIMELNRERQALPQPGHPQHHGKPQRSAALAGACAGATLYPGHHRRAGWQALRARGAGLSLPAAGQAGCAGQHGGHPAQARHLSGPRSITAGSPSPAGCRPVWPTRRWWLATRISASTPRDPALVPGKPYLSLVLSDARGISSVPELKLGERRIPFAPGALLGDGLAGIHAPLDSLPGEDGRFHIELNLQGMNALEVVPIGQDSRFNLSGNWPHPNFIGDFLPGNRTLNDQGFDASWQTSWFATDMERRFTRMMKGAGSDLPTFSVSLVQPVDHYQQNERAAKYALLFIGLTFLSFFMFELLKGLRVHPIQYALVGMGLAIFYLVLLALTEHLGFGWAYLVASLASVSLNGFYLSHVLGGPRQGLGFAALLGLVYAILFGLLQAEEIALLLGALLLFAILTLVMVLTRKLDWYGVMGNPPPSSSPSQES